MKLNYYLISLLPPNNNSLNSLLDSLLLILIVFYGLKNHNFVFNCLHLNKNTEGAETNSLNSFFILKIKMWKNRSLSSANSKGFSTFSNAIQTNDTDKKLFLIN